MNKFLSQISSPTTLLYLFLTSAQFASGIYQAGNVEPPSAFVFLYTLGFIWFLGWWLFNDSRGRSVGWVFDMGLFLYIVWPLILPYYLLKTRGARGFLAMLIFAGAYVGAFMAGMALYFLLQGA